MSRDEGPNGLRVEFALLHRHVNRHGSSITGERFECRDALNKIEAEMSRLRAEPPAAVQAGDVREGLSAEMKEFRDLFFGSEASFRNGYMCGMSDAVIVERGLKPPGKDKRWGVFSQSLKSWAPNPESIPQAQPPALTALVEAARGMLKEVIAGGLGYEMEAKIEALQNALTPFLDPAQPKQEAPNGR